MSPELDKYLCEKYPKILSERNKSPAESCMYWGFECGDGWFFIIDTLCYRIQRHIDNPSYIKKTGLHKLLYNLGNLWNVTVWNNIVYSLFKKMPYDKYKKYSDRWQFKDALYEKPPEGHVPQVVFAQVKEKFSGLRIYASGGDAYTDALISFAEDLSMNTCEVCGKTDETVGRNQNGWLRTTCCEHAVDTDDFHYNNQIVHDIFESIKNNK